MGRNVDEILGAIADLQSAEIYPINRELEPDIYFDYERAPNMISLIKKDDLD